MHLGGLSLFAVVFVVDVDVVDDVDVDVACCCCCLVGASHARWGEPAVSICTLLHYRIVCRGEVP
jgi:hypothetical protein